MYSIGWSIFYILTYIAAFLGIFALEKSKEKLNIILCLPVCVLVMMLYSAFFAGIIDIITVPINLLTLGIGNLLLAVGLFAYTYMTKKIQKYKFSWFDTAVLVVLVAFTALIAVKQFGPNLFFNYETTDPSRHIRMAEAIIETQKLGKMYFGALTNSIIMSVGLGFVKTFWAYKLFVLSDALMFLLSGCIMYCAARLYAKNIVQKIMSVAVILFYLLCYPLNNMVFGFVYLGMGVSICAYLIVMSQCYSAGIVNKVSAVVALMLGAYGIIICYSLFAPFVYIAVALFIAIKFIKDKHLISKEFFATEFGVFLIPTAMGLYFSFFKSFGGSVSEVASSIGMEGYIYRDLYANFIIILPFAIYGLINAFVTKKVGSQHILLLILAVAVLGMFVFGLKGRVSSYYFYKMYYILFMVCFIVAIQGICDLCKKSITVLVSYGLVWLFLAVMNFGKIDDKITAHRVLMSPSSSASGAFFPIIEFNLNCMEKGNFSVERMQLYEETHNKLKQGNKVTLLNTTEYVYWFEAMVQCTIKEFYCNDFATCDIQAYMQKVETACDYVLVYTEHDPIFDEYIADWQPVYQNAEGILYSVK